MIVSFDFDGTLCKHEFPKIGSPNIEMINLARRLKSEGHKLILYTCRDGEYLKDAVDWCKAWGIEFDAVNDDLPEVKKEFYCKSVKVYADIYIDDRNYCPNCDKRMEIK